MEFNATYKNVLRCQMTGVEFAAKNVLGNYVTVAKRSSGFEGMQFNYYSKYYNYYGNQSGTSNGNYPLIIVGSSTPTDYALGNGISKSVLCADSASTGSISGTRMTIRLVLRNKSESETVTISEVGLYANLSNNQNTLPQPGNASTFMIASQTVDPVTVAPGEYIAIELVLDFPEVTE